MTRDVIVVGAGAAGLLCAIEAGKRGRAVSVIERADRIGKKILISGGGRCNFTNLHATPENYISENPDFCKSALARYTPADFIALVEKHRIRFHEKTLGQLFCDGSSRQIVEMLERECREAKVEIRTGCEVHSVRVTSANPAPLPTGSPPPSTDAGNTFHLETSHGSLGCESLVIATGGLSFPKLGATDFGHRVAQQFGLKIIPPRPGLVPLVFSGKDLEMCRELAGVSLDVEVKCRGASFREHLLFTHRGVSGPAILQVSNFWRDHDAIHVDLLPGTSTTEILAAGRGSSRELLTVLSEHWPRRFAQAWCARFAPSRPMNRIPDRELEAIASRLQKWEMHPTGTEGYAKAEVTLGGVDTHELSSKTMEARRVSGLFFIGEAVDVTGWLGGYNFQWAWASGHAAGQAV